MDQEKLIKSIQTAFKLSGLRITRECCLPLVEPLRKIDPEEHQNWISKMTENLLSQNLADPCVTKTNLNIALIECSKQSMCFQDTETVFNVLDAFRIPKIKYDFGRKIFIIEPSTPDLFPEPMDKTSIFRDRFELLWQRTLKHESFAPAKFGQVDTERFHLKHIEHLLCSSKIDDVFVMGVLAQLSEGQYYLEDISGVVQIDLSQADYGSGLITEGCIVLVNGDYDNRVLIVKNITFPPSESSDKSRAHFGNANTFGGPHPVSLKNSVKLQNLEKVQYDETIVFISELWLDDQIVLDKFRSMLEEYSEYPPAAFVICGSFLSFPPNVTSSQKLKEGFQKLANIVRWSSDIARTSKFVFIPGPNDPGAPRILPRAPLPESIVEDFIKAMPNTILATNPCRIQYCTKEIVVMREDILTKLCRNTLHFPEDGEVHKHYAKSIISQSHLAPMNLQTIPIYWKHDQALQLYPTPDLIVVADQYEAYTTTYNNCQVINPGVFSKTDFPFRVYVPAADRIEDCAMEAEEES